MSAEQERAEIAKENALIAPKSQVHSFSTVFVLFVQLARSKSVTDVAARQEVFSTTESAKEDAEATS